MKTKITILMVTASVAAATVLAQSYSIDWHTIDAGGTCTGGVYSVSGTIGQSDASPTPMTNGPYSVTGGFWSLFALQTPGAPLLTITLTPANSAIVSWPSPSTGFELQQNIELNSTNWTTPSEFVADNGTNRSINVHPAPGNRFFRLLKP